MYMNPVLNAPLGPDGLPMPVDPAKVQDFFEDFYEDIFLELDAAGEVEHLCVCDNLADHMVGNVYVKFRDEESAARALQALQGRYYAGKPVQVEFSPVTDFRESTCRQYEEGTCGRGGYCNFMHVRPVAKELRVQCFGRYKGGSGGSTRFHDGAGPARGGGGFGAQRYGGGGGGGYGGGGGGGRYNGGGGGGGGRYEDRGRQQYGGGGGGSRGPPRDSSAERRAQIARWNQERGAPAPAAAPAAPQAAYGSYAAAQPPPQQPGAYGSYAAQAPPPQAPPPAYGSYAAAAPPAAYGSYAAPPQQQYGGGGGGGYGAGASGANTAPIANMRTFPPPQQ
jgi:splicing factor U2AF subunit